MPRRRNAEDRVSIGRGRPGDALQASRIECRDLGLLWTPYSYWLWLIAIRYWNVLVARTAGGRVVGAVACAPTRAGSVYMQLLIVDPEYRRRGIGTRLLRRMMARLGTRARLVGLVRVGNSASDATVRPLGFRPGRSAGRFFRDGDEYVEYVRPPAPNG